MSIRGNPIGWPLHDHDGTYLKYYGLNGCNIDSTAGIWTVDISETGYGTIPETNVNITQLSGNHFVTQMAMKAGGKENRMWIRNRFNNGAWSTWMPVINLCCAARGSSESLTLPAGTITPITLDTWIADVDNSGFAFSDGGVKVPLDGIVMVSGAVYINGSTKDTTMMEGAYVYKNDTEVAGVWQYQHATSSIATPMALVAVNAGDVIYLKARRYGAGGCLPSAAGTHLDIMYV